MLRLLGNIIWFILSGLWLGLAWWIVGVLMVIFIITIPCAKAAFVLGQFTFFPFGKTLVNRDELTAEEDIGTGNLGLIGNVVWFLFAGIWLAIAHVVSGIAWCLTIIGIPFGIQCFKLAGASIAPIGKTVVSNELALAAQKENAERELGKIRSKDD